MRSQSLATRIFNKSLDYIEKVGNKLPHPATLFGLLALIVVFVSWLGDFLSWQAVHPADGSKISVNSLVNGDGLRWMYTNITHNFVNFPPLGYVLAVMIGIGVAEGSGLFSSMIRALVLNAPKKLITGTIVFAGIISHLASEAGYVILIPLGAIIFH
ncbi:MAG: aminobenzoyl-glutamate transporter, partial [Ignavibacteriae bacterium HGW-Ignavibacteriae-3]